MKIRLKEVWNKERRNEARQQEGEGTNSDWGYKEEKKEIRNERKIDKFEDKDWRAEIK